MSNSSDQTFVLCLSCPNTRRHHRLVHLFVHLFRRPVTA